MRTERVRTDKVGTVQVAPYCFTYPWFYIARALMTKAQVICARSKETSVLFDFYDVSMSTKSKTNSKFSRVSLGELF